MAPAGSSFSTMSGLTVCMIGRMPSTVREIPVNAAGAFPTAAPMPAPTGSQSDSGPM